MGRFYDGMLVARDGVTIMIHDYVAFGMEWQVQPELGGMIFQVAREPQAPRAKCVTLSFSAVFSGKISLEDAEHVCSYLMSEQQKKMCIFDATATEDREVAEAAGAS